MTKGRVTNLENYGWVHKPRVVALLHVSLIPKITVTYTHMHNHLRITYASIIRFRCNGKISTFLPILATFVLHEYFTDYIFYQDGKGCHLL